MQVCMMLSIQLYNSTEVELIQIRAGQDPVYVLNNYTTVELHKIRTDQEYHNCHLGTSDTVVNLP